LASSKQDKGNRVRLPVSFDLTDPKQKAAYDILKNAGYGKRTPTIVDALLNSLQSVPESVSLEQRPSSTELRNVIEEAVETALRKYQLSGSAVQTPEPQVSAQDVVARKLSKAHKSVPSPLPRQPKPLERPMGKQMPEPDRPAASDGNMDVLLSMADAFY
jgi:hypothetical protein